MVGGYVSSGRDSKESGYPGEAVDPECGPGEGAQLHRRRVGNLFFPPFH